MIGLIQNHVFSSLKDPSRDNLIHLLPNPGAHSSCQNANIAITSFLNRTSHKHQSCSADDPELQKQCLTTFLQANPHSHTEIPSIAH